MDVRRRLLPTALGTAAVAALLSACSGGGPSAGSLSKGEFIKRADAICMQGSKAQDRLAEPATAHERVDYVKQIYAIERRVVQDVRALGAPSGDAPVISRMLDNVDRALALEPAVEAAAGSGNQSQINDAQAGGAKYLNDAKAIASRYGFMACGV